MKKFSYDEALSASMEFFNNDNFASTTFLNKYALRDSEGNFLESTPNDTLKRVLKELASNHYCKEISEETTKRIFGKDYTGSKKWEDIFLVAWNKWKGVCPQGSVISASGNKESLQSLSNCFVIESPEDDLESIMKASENEGQLMKRRGGVGVDLSKLRPEGTPVANAARTSTGVSGWMNHFSNVCNTIGQSGRRGALMITLDIKHPDAEGFAKAKQNLQYCTGANVSLKITDEFMDAVYEGKKFKQQFPVDSDTPSVVKEVDARELWTVICECAHKTAEPGLIMWDNAVNNLPAHNYEQFKSVSTNPSLRAGTKTITSDGIFPIEELENKEFKAKNMNGHWAPAKCFLSSPSAPLYKITLTGGVAYYATKEHKWPVFNKEKNIYEKKTTIELTKGDLFPVSRNNSLYFSDKGTWDHGFLIGVILGDGWITRRSDNQKLQIGMAINSKDIDIKNEVERILLSLGLEGNKFSLRKNTYEFNISNKILINLLEKYSVTHKSEGLPKSVWNDSSEEFRLGLLNGLFSTDGCGREGALCLTTKHEKLARDVSDLLGFYGVIGSIKFSKTSNIMFPNGKNYDREYSRYDYSVTNNYSLMHLKSLMTFVCARKNKCFDKEVKNKNITYGKILVKSIELTDIQEPVWDISVYDDTHTFQLSHCITGNCSEIILSENDACRLTTICLEGYVRNKFKEDSFFDFSSFKRDVRIAMHLMDALVSTEIVQIQKIMNKATKGSNEYILWKKIQKTAIDGRRCGLGTHGLGDTLCQLNLRYDSDDALIMIDEIYKTMMKTAYDESVEMAKEESPFPIYDYDTEKNNIFIKRLPKSLRDKMKDVGRRNISILTNAPTGTISILSQVSSGIEPTFRQMYTRRRKINNNDENSRVDFTDELGVKWMEFPIFEKNVELYFKEMGITPPDNVKNDEELNKFLSPYFITSDKIDWLKRVEVQATAQQYIDHSISSTINLPSDVTVEEVKRIYEHAHKRGLKGVTVYRDGCRSGVLVTNKEIEQDARPTNIQRTDAPKRPNKLPCEVHHTKVKGVDFVVIVGLLDSKVYELFFGEYKNESIPKKHISGFVEKHRAGKYILNFIDNTELYQVDIMEYFPNQDYQAATRMISMSLRHGTPIEYIIEQLKKSSYSVAEFGSAISRILRKYIKIEDLQSALVKKHKDENVKIVLEDGCVKIINLDTGLVESKCD